MPSIGKILFTTGLVLAGIGLIMMLSDKIPFPGKLPGDIDVKRDNMRLIFPITSSVLISLIVSGILWLFTHFRGK